MFCAKVKEFLSQNKIEFTDRNIAGDEAALGELETLGYMTTPVTVIDGEVSENSVAADEPTPKEPISRFQAAPDERLLQTPPRRPCGHAKRANSRSVRDPRDLPLTA